MAYDEYGNWIPDDVFPRNAWYSNYPEARQPITWSEDPYDWANQNRLATRGWSDLMEGSLVGTGNAYTDLQNAMLNQLRYGAGGYANILAGRGGFGPEEIANILQAGLISGTPEEPWRGALATPNELIEQYQTPEEQQALLSNPWIAHDYFQQAAPGLQGYPEESAARQRAALGSLAEGLQGSIDQQALEVSPEYYPGVQDALQWGHETYGGAIDPALLGLSGEFTSGYRFGPEDEQRLADQAARTVAARTQARQDQLRRGLAAEGNVNPLAVQAAEQRNQAQGDIAAADAMTDARIRGRELALNTLRGKEQERLGAERDISGRYMQAAGELLPQELAQRNLAEQMRLGSERDISGRLSDVASQIGQTELGTERGVGQERYGAARDVAGTMTGLKQGAEAESQRRNAERISNRQQTGQWILGTRYGQRMPASQALSGRYSQVYGQKKGEEAEGRGFMTDLYGSSQAGAQTTAGQRLGAGQTLISGLNQPLGTMTNYRMFKETQPKLWEKLAQFGIGAAGAFGGGR